MWNIFILIDGLILHFLIVYYTFIEKGHSSVLFKLGGGDYMRPGYGSIML